MTLLHPFTIVHFVAVVPGGQAGAADQWAQRAVFVAAMLASANCQFLLAVGGSAASAAW
ncbi:hypothetical protein [Saccharopolyspora aridisoli]|uniref:hypothetical protein n=1 Tax=Saccharopolyspora aridisoli TaxID=2530385 RepID=UPI001404B911|nr:hypothetical protein [Saccharopolyspora aridisoli]